MHYRRVYVCVQTVRGVSVFWVWLSEQSCSCTTWSFGLKRSTPIKKPRCGIRSPPTAKSAYSRETQLLIPLLVPCWPARARHVLSFPTESSGAAGICCLFNILLHSALSAKAIVAHIFLSHLPDLTTRLANCVWMVAGFAAWYLALLTLGQGYGNKRPLSMRFK